MEEALETCAEETKKDDLTLWSERHWVLRQEGLGHVSHHVHLKAF